jgi:uncharacterized SAM-binding protein YcdF (DUF218 family)
MKLNSPILTFTVVMVAICAGILVSFVLPLGQALAVSFVIFGLWLIALGTTQKAKTYELMVTSPSAYMIYGGLLMTASATYLVYAHISDFRVLLLVLVLGITVTVLLSYFVGKHGED